MDEDKKQARRLTIEEAVNKMRREKGMGPLKPQQPSSSSCEAPPAQEQQTENEDKNWKQTENEDKNWKQTENEDKNWKQTENEDNWKQTENEDNWKQTENEDKWKNMDTDEQYEFTDEERAQLEQDKLKLARAEGTPRPVSSPPLFR